jgi:nitrogen regulatory protein PII
MSVNGDGYRMKMVIAIIRHERLQEVQDVLDECGVSGVTVTEVKGCGAQRGYTEKYRGAAVHISLRPRIKVEAVMQSEIVGTVVDKLAAAARSTEKGEVGDGKIFVMGVEDAVRIRTGEHGPETVRHAARAMWGH